MFEAMGLLMEGSRTYQYKVRKGFYATLEEAKKVAKEKAQGVPWVRCNGKAVWSPLHDKLINKDFIRRPI